MWQNERRKEIQTNLKSLAENNDTPQGRVVDLTIQGLIVVSLLSSSVNTLPTLSKTTLTYLFHTQVAIVAIFTAEYILRIVVADSKIRFMRSFYGVIDLLAILPFYLSLGVGLESIRILRLLRLFHMFKLFRYNSAIERFHQALILVREELVLFSIVSAMLLYFAAVGIYYFEHTAQPEAFSSVFQGFWWAIATLTTVGYGDIYPVTTGGKVFTLLVLVIGLGVVAVPTGIVAAALSAARSRDPEASPPPTDHGDNERRPVR